MDFAFNPTDLIALSPVIAVVVTALSVLVADVFAKPETDRAYAGYLSVFGLAIGTVLALTQWGAPAHEIFGGMLAADDFGVFFNVVLLVSTAAVLLTGMGYFTEHGLHRGEFYAMMLMSLSGMMLMAMARDLVSFFIGLEIMSIAVYVLAAYRRHENRSVEAALKYFLVGAFATAFLLFGIAMIYGMTGTTDIADIAAAMSAGGEIPLIGALGTILIVIAFSFKIAAVPFHMWAPDAYDGAPTPVTSFMAGIVKAAAFAAFIRLFTSAFFAMKLAPYGWYNIFYILAILTMTLGNLSALTQDNIKRMLAYSSIAHAGYLLLGFITITQSTTNNGAASLLYYLAAYAAMNVGAFGVVIFLGKNGNENLSITNGWAGIGRRAPALGVAMTIFMLSLAGMPPTAGFMGKFYIFKSAIDQGLIVIAIIGILNSLVSVYYYLRVTVVMYMLPDGEDPIVPLKSLPMSLAVLGSVVAVLGMGILPSDFLSAAQQAVASLF